jgi:hypothetical protein
MKRYPSARQLIEDETKLAQASPAEVKRRRKQRELNVIRHVIDFPTLFPLVFPQTSRWHHF